MSNYPPGVTGDEFEIAGPDEDIEVVTPCPECAAHSLSYLKYKHKEWLWCSECRDEFEIDAFEWYTTGDCNCQSCT